MPPRGTPETIDRFKISAQVEKAEVGELLAQLIKLGFANIQYELITDVIGFRQNRPPIVQEAGAPPLMLPAPEKKSASADGRRFEDTGEDVVWRHVKNRKRPFRASEIGVLFRSLGRKAHSVSPVLWKLVQDGYLRKAKAEGPGFYQVVNGKKAMKRHVSTNVTANLRKQRPAVSNRALVLDYAKDHKKFSTAEIRKLFADNDRPSSSATSTLSTMKGDGYLKGDGEGQYLVVTLSADKLNGTGAHANG